MGTILICDDSAMDRHVAARLLEHAGHAVLYAEDGKQGADLLRQHSLDVVLTDLQMPNMDGLALVQHIRVAYPAVPVILMTAFGSEEVAVQALQAGAAYFVPKQVLASELVSTVNNMLMLAKGRREERAIPDCLVEASLQFVLENDIARVGALVGHFQQQMKALQLCDEADLTRVGLALQEALLNAIEHGNLELDSRLRESPNGSYQRLADQRRLEAPYRQRRVYISARFTRALASFSIRDEGPGFDPRSLPDPTAGENVGKVSGRGLFLIRTFMDDVCFNPTGNEIVLIKRRR